MDSAGLKKWTVILLTFGDTLMALFFFFPMVCLYWRGAWDLIGYYVLRGREPLNFWVHAILGCCSVFDYFIAPILDRCLRKNSMCFILVTRIFLAYHGILFMFLWRGVWMLADHYFTRDWRYAGTFLIIDLVILGIIGCIRSTMWPPYMVAVDVVPDLLKAANRFHSTPATKVRYVLDSAFTAIVVNIFAICAWRCVWCVWDGLIYPNDFHQSSVVCLICGVTSSVILLSSQRGLAEISKRLQEHGYVRTRIVFEDVMYVFIFLSLSTLWRGGWNLNTIYLIPDPLIGGWVNHVIGMLLFLIFQTYSLVGGLGCGIDGEDSDGGAFYPIKYLRLIMDLWDEISEESRDDVEKEEFPLEINKPNVNHNGPQMRTPPESPLHTSLGGDESVIPLVKANRDRSLNGIDDPWVLRDDLEEQIPIIYAKRGHRTIHNDGYSRVT